MLNVHAKFVESKSLRTSLSIQNIRSAAGNVDERLRMLGSGIKLKSEQLELGRLQLLQLPQLLITVEQE